MKKLFFCTLLIILSIPLSAQNGLEKFVGTWEMVPGTLKSDPMPEQIDPESVMLEVTCTMGHEGYSVTCVYNGGKTISEIPFKSKGREMLVLDPGSSMIYKLGLTNNASAMESMPYEKTFVNIGKGVFNEKGELELTEYIAGNDPPAGKAYLFMEK